jgi:hypothetical protein
VSLTPSAFEAYLASTLPPNPTTGEVARLLAEYRARIVRECSDSVLVEATMDCEECGHYSYKSKELDAREVVKDAIFAIR